MKGDGFNLVLNDCKLKIADKPKNVKSLISNLVKITRLKTLGNGDLQKGSKRVPGYSGTQIIETSHIAVHGFSKENSYIITIVSCEEFNIGRCIRRLLKIFKPKYYSITTFKIEI